KEFAEKFRLILRYLGVSDADMEKGQMRVEVNISVKKKGEREYGTKVEIKNLNSIRSAALAVDYEIERQTSMLEDGHRVVQETRGWDEIKQSTFSQRLKETAKDYRYFPEPDLPVLNLDDQYIETIKAELPELPEQRKERLKKEYGLVDAQIEILTTDKRRGEYFENVVSELVALDKKSAENYNKVANFVISNMTDNDLERISPEALAELVVMATQKLITSTTAAVLLKEMAITGLHPEAIAKEKNLLQVSDISELEKMAEELISENPGPVADYKKGKKEVLKFLVGKMMAKTKGQANPQVAADLLEKILQ
ncbi:MAG: Asp-tRNA(Asn)/Glu-tRNA(Gln) amidotransferase subunit GatB, partial [bacterium]|nr:Asp-tRNA(Asn)/Glu-tRNA(Gln) amidotransferase subunit GatB [bacterium]